MRRVVAIAAVVLGHAVRGHAFVRPAHGRRGWSSFAQASAASSEFEAWVRDNDVVAADGLAVSRDPTTGLRGLSLARGAPSLAAGASLVSAPLRATLHVWDSGGGDSSSAASRALASADDAAAEASDLSWLWRLAAKLLAERARGRDSPFAPWIAMLPKEPPPDDAGAGVSAAAAAADDDGASLPLLLHWSFEQLPPYAPLCDRVFSLQIQAGLRATPRGGGGGGGHDEAAWLWAFATVLSRAFRLPRADLPPSPGGSGAAVDGDGGDADDRGDADALGGRGGSDLVVLCPLADLLNHGRAAPETASEWYFDARTGRVGARAGGAGRAAGRECRINYGAKSNDALLLNYGFVEEDNPDDVYEFEAGALGSLLLDSIGDDGHDGRLAARIRALAAADADGAHAAAPTIAAEDDALERDAYDDDAPLWPREKSVLRRGGAWSVDAAFALVCAAAPEDEVESLLAAAEAAAPAASSADVGPRAIERALASSREPHAVLGAASELGRRVCALELAEVEASLGELLELAAAANGDDGDDGASSAREKAALAAQFLREKARVLREGAEAMSLLVGSVVDGGI